MYPTAPSRVVHPENNKWNVQDPHCSANVLFKNSNLSNCAALLWHAFKSLPAPSNQVNWAGKYLLCSSQFNIPFSFSSYLCMFNGHYLSFQLSFYLASSKTPVLSGQHLPLLTASLLCLSNTFSTSHLTTLDSLFLSAFPSFPCASSKSKLTRPHNRLLHPQPPLHHRTHPRPFSR